MPRFAKIQRPEWLTFVEHCKTFFDTRPLWQRPVHERDESLIAEYPPPEGALIHTNLQEPKVFDSLFLVIKPNG
jgi:hypothetical protein